VRLGVIISMLLLLGTTSVFAQQGQRPQEFTEGSLKNAGAHPQFSSAPRTSPATELALESGLIASVPHYSRTFAYQGRTFRYTMVGGDPGRTDETRISTQIIPISLFFEGMVDDRGEPLVLSADGITGRVLNSPNFRVAAYATGTTQFGDAAQRAQFYSQSRPDWHTILERPAVLAPVTVYVPANPAYARVFRNSATGAVFAVVDSSFFVSQLNTIVELEHLDHSALVLAVTNNVFLSAAPESFPLGCCTLGFHTAFDGGQVQGKQAVQTLVWASWIEGGIMAPGFADVTAISHEISEWMSDPFATNAVPSWQYPNTPGKCQSNLETGDPISVLPNPSTEVMIDGFTYHPQSQALLQWFTRENPSGAYEGAYSFPNQGLLTGPSQACATQ